jgi:prolyl-tRNA editing enzyme YbaK/EbsC (Cys-tRNA(Pro) deacylase)
MPSDAILDTLARLGVPHEVLPIDPKFADTEAFCRQYGYPLDRSANTIIVASRKEPKQYAACVVLADTKLDVNGVVRRLMGVPRASFASAEEMRALTGMEVGGVTPFALPEDVPLYVDARIPPLDWIILGGGGRDRKVKIGPEVLERLGARVILDLAKPAQS